MATNLKPANFFIPKTKDSILLGVVSALCNACSAVRIHFEFFAGGEHLDLRPDELLTNSTINKISELDSHSFERIAIHFNTGCQANIRSPNKEHSQLFLSVTVDPGSEQNRERFIELIGKSKTILGEVCVDTTVRDALASADKDYIDTREAFIQRQEQHITATSERLDKFFLELIERHDEKRLLLEAEYKSRLDENDLKYQQRLDGLAEREEALNQRIADLNLKESKGERRQTIKELIAQLDSSSDTFKFALTTSTQNMRWPVWGFTLMLLSCLLALVGFLVSNEFRTADPTGYAWLRTSASAIVFITAFAFFIRWLNHWAESHAKEEFRLKRLLLQVRRANLLIETALEWQKEANKDLPPELLAALSRDLFKDEDDHESVAPVETLATILGESSQIKLKLLENEILLNRRAMKRLKKTPNHH